MKASRETKWRLRAQQKAQARASAKIAARKLRHEQARAQARADAEAAEDTPPEDMDEFRNELSRRIHVIVGNRRRHWRACPERCCRRARACRTPQETCSNAPPPEDLTPERIAQLQVKVKAA